MNRRISEAATASCLVAEAGAALAAQLLAEAGGLVAAGREGGATEAVLQVHHVVDQLLGGGDLRHKSKGFISGGCGNAVLD